MSPVGNCPGCGGDEPFEQIHLGGCPDADGGECPEWACTACGAAVIMGTTPGGRDTWGASRAGVHGAGAVRQTVRAA